MQLLFKVLGNHSDGKKNCPNRTNLWIDSLNLRTKSLEEDFVGRQVRNVVVTVVLKNKS